MSIAEIINTSDNDMVIAILNIYLNAESGNTLSDDVLYSLSEDVLLTFYNNSGIRLRNQTNQELFALPEYSEYTKRLLSGNSDC